MKNSTILFIHRVFKGIADSTIKVFIPLLILTITGDMQLCFIYATVDFILTAFCFAIFKNLVKKFPFISLIISIIPLLAMSLLLILKLDFAMIMVLAILDAIYSVLYYGALNLIFGFVDKDADTAKLESGKNVGQIIFTLLSAYVLGNLKNSLVFVIIFSVSLYICCVIPIIWKYKQLRASMGELPKSSTIEMIRNNKYFNIFHIFTGAFSFIIDIFLPVYLYSKGLSFTAIGVVLALQYLLCIIGSYLAGFLHKKGMAVLSIILNCCIIVAALLVTMLVDNKYACFVAAIFLAMANHMIYVPYLQLFTRDRMEAKDYQDAIFYRDVFQCGGRGVLGEIYLLFPNFIVMFGAGFVIALGLATFGTLLSKKVKPKDLPQSKP